MNSFISQIVTSTQTLLKIGLNQTTDSETRPKNKSNERKKKILMSTLGHVTIYFKIDKYGIYKYIYHTLFEVYSLA